jgi:hypothetical protein
MIVSSAALLAAACAPALAIGLRGPSSDQLNCWSDYLIKFKIDRLKLAPGRKNKQPTSAVLWFELLCQRERDARAPSADVVLF